MKNKKLTKLIFLISAVLLIAVNCGVLILSNLKESMFVKNSITSDFDSEVIFAEASPNGEVVYSTTDNTIIFYQDGFEKSFEQKYENLVTGVEFYENNMFVFTAFNEIYIYDKDNNLVGEYKLNGKIQRIEPVEDGFILLYGKGVTTDKHYVEKRDMDLNVVYSHQTHFYTKHMEMSDSSIIYCTDDANLVKLDLDGNQIWNARITDTPTSIQLGSKDEVVISDESGNVHKYSADGNLLWSMDISDFAVNGLMADIENSRYIVTTSNGGITFLNDDGEVLLSKLFNREEYSSIISMPNNEVYIVKKNGDTILIDNNAIGFQIFYNNYKNVIIAVDIILAVITVVMILIVFEEKLKLKHLLKRMFKARMAYLLILPSLVLILIFGYLPAIRAFIYSFTDFSIANEMSFVGLENYAKMFSDSQFLKGLTNTVIIMVVQLVKVFSFPLLVAELVFWLKNKKTQYLFRTAFIIPNIVPVIVTVLLWKMIYDPTIGLINQFLETVGLENLQRAWLADESTALASILFAGFPWVRIFPFLIILGGLISIDQSVFESAKIDGATAWQRFWRIDIPMIAPQLGVLVFFSYTNSFNMFNNIWIYTRGGPNSSTYVPALHMFLNISEGNYAYASTIGVFLFVLVFTVTMVRRKFSKSEQ